MKKNIAIVCNKMAGAGRAISMAKDILNELARTEHFYTAFIGDWPNEYAGFTDIFIVGGDGTMNHFINRYPEINLPLVLFNGGTGNDFHWTLYGNKSFQGQMNTALTVDPKPIDIGMCNESYFINGVGIGFEAAISKALTGKKKLPGKTSFYISVLKNIFRYRSKNYSLKTTDRDFNSKYLLIDIYNGKRAGGGFYIAPEAIPNDGLFDFISAKDLSPVQRLRYLPVIEKGKHLKLPFIHYVRTDKIEIESDDTIQFHLDGEYHEAEKLKIEILPSKLYFRY